MEFLTTKGIAASIEKIIRNADNFIAIVSPYVKVDKTYIERLLEAERNDVDIHIVFGKEEMSKLEKEKFKDFSNLNLRFLENLHAKCYMNENTAIITSMNLYGYSEENNREMGVEIQQNEDFELYNDIKKEVKSILEAAEEYHPNSRNPFSNNLKHPQKQRMGHCIRCGQPIPYNPAYPLCNNCYSTWNQYGDENYPENYCHKCGDEFINISYARPQCPECWKEWQFELSKDF